MKPVYRCLGPVRALCGHEHRTLSGAERCLYADQAVCSKQGGYSDRRIVGVTDEGWERELTDEEFEQLDQTRVRPWAR
mgnify:FL=1